MEKQIITFSANEQKLTKTGGLDCYASNTVAYIEARFDLGDNWSGYDSVRAVWWNDYNKTVSTVLDPDGVCIVPYEVLTHKSVVRVNLVGSIVQDDVLTDRITTCPAAALVVKCNAKVTGDNAKPITPSQFEQFVDIVKADVEKVTGMTATAETLPVGSDATASYSDGVLTLGIPKGDKGEKGDSVKGDKGDTGNGIASITHTGTSGAVKTYTITFTDGTSQTYDVTDGQVTTEQMDTAIDNAVTDLKSDLNNKFDSLASLEDTPFDIQWEHGGIDNATGATNNDGSLVRSRDSHYYKPSDFATLKNGSSATTYIIFYTKSGDTYTFSSAKNVNAGATYSFDHTSTLYFRLDVRAGFDGAKKVKLLYTSEIVEFVDRLTSKEVLFNELPQKENLFDKTKAVSDKYIKNTDGTEGTYASYYATDFIPIRKGVTYYTGGVYASYNALYDENKEFVSGNVVTAANNLGTFTPSVDGFFRGTITSASYLDCVYVSPYHPYFTDYVGIDYSFASAKLTEENALNARGEDTPNLFKGNCYYGSINTSTGAETFSYEKIVTPFIAISGILYYKLFNGKSGDIAIVFEYDDAKTLIDYHSLSGKPIGMRVLDANTRYIKFTTLVASANYELPDTDEMSRNLLVASDIKVLGRLATNHNITGQESVRYDLFDKSIAFEKSYVKSAIATYRDTLRDTFYDFVMPMNTDLHTIDSEPYNMLTYMAESGMADICFNLGDNVPDHFDTRAETVAMLEAVRLWNSSNNQKCELLVLRGNHDNNPTSDDDVSKMISDSLYYNIFQHRTKKGFYKAGLNYGFLDFEQSKIRVIWLDSGDIYDHTTGEPLTSGYNVMVQQDQFDWFCDVALDFSNIADRDEWSVITVSHAQISSQLSTAFEVVLKAFMDGTAVSGSASTAYGDYTNTLTYNVDFSSQGAMEYICHVNGHTHDDNAVLIGNTGRYDIDIACDNGTAYYYVGSTRTAYTRTAGTIEEHIMDTLCLDKANRKIYMKRLGVGSDREFNY